MFRDSKDTILVDGANVAYIDKNKKGQPKIQNIEVVRKKLIKMGYKPIVIIDASIRHKIDNPNKLEKMIERDSVLQAPADTDSDYFILEAAEQKKAKVVSNDQFDSYTTQYNWIKNKRVPLMIVEGDVQFYKLKPLK